MKKSSLFPILAALFFFGSFPTPSHGDYWGDSTGQPKTDAPQDKVTAPDNRMEKRFGVYASLLGDPLISLAGVDFAYNATDYLRLNGGIGASLIPPYESGLSVGVGAKFLVPHAEFSPVAGLNLSVFSLAFGGDGSNGFLFSYFNLGLDYQAKDGFDLGFGIDFGLTQPSSNTADYQIDFQAFPYLNLGGFF